MKERYLRASKKRRIWWIAAVWMLVLCGCSRQEEIRTEITVIHGWGSNEKDHVAMRQIYSDFEKENPDVQVHLVSMPTSKDLIRKVGDLILVGEMPDVIFFGGSGNNSIYNYMVKNGLAVDMMPYIEADPEFADHIASSNMEYWKTLEGGIYSISDTLTLSGGYWYNEDIFYEAGIQRTPESWEEFLEVCERIKRWSDENDKGVKPLQVSTEGYLYFMDHMLASNSGKAEKSIEWHKVTIEQNEMEQVLEKLKKIYGYSAENNENYSYRDETDLFNEGKLAIYINGVWGAPMISEEVNARYALIPADGVRSMSCESTGLGYILGKTGIEARQEASVRFIKYMLSDAVQERILQETEQVPVNANVNLEIYKEEMQRFYQAVQIVKAADKKIETPENLWHNSKSIFEEHILEVLEEEITTEEFIKLLQ